MYVEKKKINNKEYNYLKVSVRVGNKVKTGTVAYLGKSPMSKKDISEKIKSIPKRLIEKTKNRLKQEVDVDKLFLTKNEINVLSKIKKEYHKKLKNPDKKLVEDMFKDFKTYYIYNTNAIEGNTLSLADTNLLLNENKSPEGKDLREIYDHINEKETFDYLLANKPKINKEAIIDIHKRLLKKIDKRTGNFRKHNVRVFGASFKTTDAKHVETDMNLLVKWYNKHKRKINPLILAAIFHEKFERIHPFYDGNGRTGRMLLNLILIQYDFPLLIIKNKTRKEYYAVLDKGHKADLDQIDKNYEQIIRFCYKQLLETYNNIFSKWG